MIETNMRLVLPGLSLSLPVRVASIMTQDLAPEAAEKACSGLRRRKGLSAVPDHEESTLLVATQRPIGSLSVGGDDWLCEVRDSGVARVLRFAESEDQSLVAQLIERLLLIRIGRATKLWTLDSPRIWYESAPFATAGEVAAYRRFEVSAVPIDCTGVGLTVNVSTAFFTVQTVADFFDQALVREEAARRKKCFDALGQRQRGQKGTLVYDQGTSHTKCYFDSIPGTTCSTTGKLRAKGENYPSLLDYYRQRYPTLAVEAEDVVARVSFPGMDHAVPVAAKLLRLRVGTEGVPTALKNVDKIPPDERCKMIEAFWASLGSHPLGPEGPALASEFWKPSSQAIVQVKPSSLAFGGGQYLKAPGATAEYKSYYRNRLKLLDKVGCFYVPPPMPRQVHFAVPGNLNSEITDQLAEGITALLSRWTRKSVTAELCSYERMDDAFTQLQQLHPGVAVIVFENRDPTTYFAIAHELKTWRVKRIIAQSLRKQFKSSRWQALVEHSALEVLQQLDCVPWIPASDLHYEAHLAIDVGEDRRYFALSLLICRTDAEPPVFRIDTVVEVKPDPKYETINEVILRDKVLSIFRRMHRSNDAPLRSVLVVRDGHEAGREREGIAEAIQELVRENVIAQGARTDIIDFHKRSLKGIRAWDRDSTNTVANAIEGSGVILGRSMAVLLNTGAATLRQGTAEPVILASRDGALDLRGPVCDLNALAQLNFSSPNVAQRLPLHLKRTDDELKARAAQEIRRIT